MDIVSKSIYKKSNSLIKGLAPGESLDISKFRYVTIYEIYRAHVNASYEYYCAFYENGVYRAGGLSYINLSISKNSISYSSYGSPYTLGVDIYAFSE